MANFDKVIRSFFGFPGYTGEPPTNEDQYNSMNWSGEWSPPTWQEINAAYFEEQKLEVKDKAKKLIADSDWAMLPDTGLKNQSDYVVYRSALRSLILNPVADPVWPTEPTPEWG
jgi:hypothetical protein